MKAPAHSKFAKTPPSLPHRQRGLVMLMVVGVVVLMITLLALMLEDQHIMIRQVANQRVAEQSLHYSNGLNAWAMRVLHEDENPLSDNLSEKWAKFGRPAPEADEEADQGLSASGGLGRDREEEEESATIDFGIDTVEVTIDDLQGRFNLNNLLPITPAEGGRQAGGQAAAQGPKQTFLNLLQILEIGEFFEDRVELYNALIDWMDENKDNVSAGPTESGDYQVRSVPYFASDQPLSSVGELRYVHGFTKDIISELRPFVTVLPSSNVNINLNTVSAEVLAAFTPGTVVDANKVEGFLARRDLPGFQGFTPQDINEAWTAILGVSPSGANPQQSAIGAQNQRFLGVTSQFFQINAKVELGDHQVCTRTVVLRKGLNGNTLQGGDRLGNEQSVSVLSREQDTICKEEETGDNEAGQDESSDDEDIR